MPRRARLRIAGHPLHVIQRGNNRSSCFRNGADYELYLGLLNELGAMFECAIHAYVLMTNHVHLLLTPRRADGPSHLMKHLGQRYVQHYNRTHLRTGSLWEGRFRSSIVDSERYLFRCQRYIELNPVRAGMVADPWEYPWSSYLANAGRTPSLFLVPHHQYEALGASEDERTTRYCELFRDELTTADLDEIRAAANGGFVLGSPAFVAGVERALKRRAARGVSGRPRKARHRHDVPPDGKPWSVPGFRLTSPGGGVR